jgi:TRAP-type mannitol/chloroaromatic compound transport system permease large subunit
MGGKEIITDLIVGLAIPPLGILLVMLSMIFVLGMFLDFIGIMYILIPIYVVIIPQFGWDPIWFALLFCVTMQTAWLTPPFGYSLFYLRAITPPEITFAHIIRGCAPFIGLQLIGLGILIAFPQLILWLPRLVGY